MANNKKNSSVSSSKIKFPDPMKSFNTPTSDYKFSDEDELDNKLPRRN